LTQDIRTRADYIYFGEAHMSNIHTTIKFDGPALDGKAMDVAHLAPGLLALSDLVKETNRFANGDRAGYGYSSTLT
jgi:hypothetical protein